MTDWLIGGYGADMGGTAIGIGLGRSAPDGRFEYLGVAAETASPSWVTIDRDRVYAALEGSAAVDVFEFANGRLGRLETMDVAGQHPCHLAVVDGRPVVACYGDGMVWTTGGTIAGSPSDRGPLPAQDGPHAHHVLPLADGRVLTLDLGTDRVYLHRWSGTRLIRYDELALPPGTGPRDLLLTPGGRVAVLGEWSCELLLLAPAGESYEIGQIVALPGSAPGSDQAAALGLSSDGRFVFAGIRGSDRIATLALGDHGATPVGWAPSGGKWPRHLVVDGAFVHVANQLSNTVATLRIGADGTLSSHGDPVAVPSPTCLAPVGAFANV